MSRGDAEVRARRSVSDMVCEACRSRECCSRLDTPVTLRDVARIARALAVAPEIFCDSRAAASDDASALDLGGDQGRRSLVLRRREGADGGGACLFLLNLGASADERRLCGLGELAPAFCHVFPVATRGAVYAGDACWRSWRWEELDPAVEEAGLRRRDAEAGEHRDAVARWNELVARRPGRYSLATALAFLLNEAAEVDR